jgi:hypothetical protein
MGVLLVVCGLVATVLAGWASYGNARAALGPLVHDQEPTRAAIDSTRPVIARTRVRLFARHLALALGWLLVAFYGLWLAVQGTVVR